MSLYRRKPGKPVEAVQWTQSAISDWNAGRGHPGVWRAEGGAYYVVTIHGQNTFIKPGDWILPEPDGKHYYPCAAEVFAGTYEEVANDPVADLADEMKARREK